MAETYPEPTPRRTDVVLQQAAGRKSGCLLLVIAFFWNAVSYAVAGGLWLTKDNIPWFAWLIITLFPLVGLVLLIAAVRRLMAEAKLHPPQVTVAIQPLYLGEELTGRFDQTAKSHAIINNVTVKLICRESAIYRSGTDTRTVTHDVLSEEFTLPGVQNADAQTGLHGEFRFRIPEEAMHSFSAHRNKIQWLLETHTDVAGWPDYKATLALEIAPQRVAARGS